LIQGIFNENVLINTEKIFVSYKVAINGNHPLVDKILKAGGEEAQQKLAKQAFDLAMLSQGLLTGKDLTAFVKRSVEMI
jgi:molecular chaperone HtpG